MQLTGPRPWPYMVWVGRSDSSAPARWVSILERAILSKLHADAGGAIALCALRRNPGDPANHRHLLVVLRQAQQDEHLIPQRIGMRGRDEQAAVVQKRHVGGVEGVFILYRQRQDALPRTGSCGIVFHALASAVRDFWTSASQPPNALSKTRDSFSACSRWRRCSSSCSRYTCSS